jgi:hypothetical protein
MPFAIGGDYRAPKQQRDRRLITIQSLSEVDHVLQLHWNIDGQPGGDIDITL